MALTTLGDKLLRVGQKLALSAYCCCTGGRWCETLLDECGNLFGRCTSANTGVECTAACGPPPTGEPCECGPDKSCPECFECIDQKCVRIEGCCTSDEDCGPCSKCVNGVCEPCGECEQCLEGICLPCGPCQKCEDGACIECGADEVCIAGVCVPKQYYCCWASCADKRLNTNNTTCKAATVSGETQTNPCGTGTEEGYGSCDLTKSGPHVGLQQCQPNCQKYKCAPDACGDNECSPDPSGPYSTRAACEAACLANPCTTPCTFTGASAPGTYSIDACERDICVSYVSPLSRPIRVQIWGPTLDANCNIIANDVIKADSGWRGEECCDCASRPGGDLDGGPKGQIKWKKPRGVTFFRVAVLTACNATANIDIRCSDNCGDPPDPSPCPCTVNANCNEGCHCCGGECQEQPCRVNCDEFQNWTIQTTFCGETLIWSTDPTQNNGNPGAVFRKDFTKPPNTGGCCWFGTGDVCSPFFERRTGAGNGRTTYTILHAGTTASLWLSGGRCTGSISIVAEGPSADCSAFFCVRWYTADIINGQLVNVQRSRDFSNCGCDDHIGVSLTYFPAP